MSSNRDLTDIAVGAGYGADFGGGSWSAGIGYNKFDSFFTTSGVETFLVEDINGDVVVVEGDAIQVEVPDGEQWSVGVSADYEALAFGVTYTRLDSDTSEQILELMLRLNREKGVTFLFSTHDPRVVGHARRVLKIQDGRMAPEAEAEVDDGDGLPLAARS